MASPAPARPGPVRRFGPLAVVVVALLVVAVVSSAKGRPPDRAASGKGATSGPTAVGAAENSDLPTYFDDADDRNEAGEHEWGNCDFVTGRVKVPSVYAPPCVPVHEGSNGGATTPGVTEDVIKVVAYRSPPGNDLFAALQGLLDSEDIQQRTREKYVEMFNDVYETYGRRVELEVLVGSGAADDATAAVRDAIRVAEEIKPFAVLSGPALTSKFAETLADNGIICIGCGLSVPDSVYQENAPYMWGQLPTPEQFLRNFGDFVQRRLFRRPAEFAGPELRERERVFGTINFDQDPPVFTEVRAEVNARGKLRGYEAAVAESYILDVAKLPERAATIVAKMKAAEVTTIIFVGDPIMPQYLTAAATREDYYPEWVIAGTVLTDTTALGRTYDPAQWANAFGVSNLAGRRPIDQQEQWRLYEWFFGEEPEARQTTGIIYPNVLILMLGIHMAGPNLTPETFRDGLFSYPPSGGGPTTPQFSFGNHGFFAEPDYLLVDDVAEIWWDPEFTGPDEQGKSEKPGAWRYANGGTRYIPGRIGNGPLAPHDPATSPALFTELPPVDQYPEYPPPDR